MENKQPLFLIIALLVFGVALASAIWVFSRQNVTAHRDELVSEISLIASDAYLYKHRPRTTGGGGGSYAGYHIPEKLRANEHAEFTVADSAGVTLNIRATSTHGIGTVSASVDRDGKVQNVSFSGDFLSEQ